MENTTLHFEWALPMAADIAAAQQSIVATSLSLHAPRKANGNNIGLLWDALAHAIDNGSSVHFFLANASKSHPATIMNYTAGEALHRIGAKVHFLNVANLLHAKTVAIDRSIAWVGSGNWTQAAAAHNREAYLRAACPAIADQLAARWLSEIALKA